MSEPNPEMVAKHGEPITICEDCNNHVYKGGAGCTCRVGRVHMSHKEQIANGLIPDPYDRDDL